MRLNLEPQEPLNAFPQGTEPYAKHFRITRKKGLLFGAPCVDLRSSLETRVQIQPPSFTFLGLGVHIWDSVSSRVPCCGM